MVEDNISNYYGHFLKTYLGEGIVRDHKCLIVDPDTLRTAEYWYRFLPQASVLKAEPARAEESKTDAKLQVAWRYQD